MNKKICILIIDDDYEDQQIIREAFDLVTVPTGNIEFVDDGQMALDLLADYRDKMELPNLIVLDLNMPRMSGVETLHNLKTNDLLKSIPVIILSSSFNPQDIEDTKNEGAIDYITKPSTFTQFREIADKFSMYCAA